MKLFKPIRGDFTIITVDSYGPLIVDFKENAMVMSAVMGELYFYKKYRHLDFLNFHNKKVNEEEEALKLMQLFLDKFDVAMVFS